MSFPTFNERRCRAGYASVKREKRMSWCCSATGNNVQWHVRHWIFDELDGTRLRVNNVRIMRERDKLFRRVTMSQCIAVSCISDKFTSRSPSPLPSCCSFLVRKSRDRTDALQRHGERRCALDETIRVATSKLIDDISRKLNIRSGISKFRK